MNNNNKKAVRPSCIHQLIHSYYYPRWFNVIIVSEEKNSSTIQVEYIKKIKVIITKKPNHNTIVIMCVFPHILSFFSLSGENIWSLNLLELMRNVKWNVETGRCYRCVCIHLWQMTKASSSCTAGESVRFVVFFQSNFCIFQFLADKLRYADYYYSQHLRHRHRRGYCLLVLSFASVRQHAHAV